MSGPAVDAAEPWDTITGPARAEREVTRSRFVATLAPALDDAAAEQVVAAIRQEFPDARHHCVATVHGSHGEQRRGDDDGEPGGTAGAPMLAALAGARLTDVVAVVTRYFGGTLLGSGGLVRAYGGAVADAVRVAERRSRAWVHVLTIRTGHADAGQLENRLRAWARRYDAEVASARHGPDDVALEVVVPVEGVDDLVGFLGATPVAHRLEAGDPEVRDRPGG
jgi:uncharacterized YigZ family protein